MLDFVECTDTNILKVMAGGELTHADQMAFFERLRSLFEKRGKIRVLWDLKDGRSPDVRAAQEDPTLALRYRDEVSRLAVVGSSKDQPEIGWLFRSFVPVRFFRPAERDEAWRWVTEGTQEMTKTECIRRLAYSKWEAAGRPPGDGVPFWLEAEREVVGAMSA